jgi:protoheme IX farnesyltransferase
MRIDTASDMIDIAPASVDSDAVIASSSVRPSRWADFYELTKPRMNFLILITTLVGFYVATGAGNALNWLLLLPTLIGTGLCAAGASVLNQYIERDLDKLMPRTRNRPLPGQRIMPAEALITGIVMGIAGTITLLLCVNLLTAALGAFTLLSYVLVYTPLKRITTLNTIVGAVPGAIPPVMGFTAVHGAISPGALAVFGILFFWQMPHFLAIAILYKRDYAMGGYKMLPVVDSDGSITSRQIVHYAIALIPVSMLPTFTGIAGPAYFAVALMLGLAFLSFCVSCAATRTRLDARKLFFASIIYLPVLLAVMMLDRG